MYNIALGDVVLTSPIGDRKYVVKNLIERSGHYVFRVWFGDSFQPRDEVIQELESLDSLIEQSSSNLLAVDAIDETHATALANHLAERERLGHLIYETGRS